MLKVIFCAAFMEAEYALLNPKFGFKKILESPFEVWQNQYRTVIITGIGLVNASVAFAWACRNLNFKDAINIGTAGANITGYEALTHENKLGKFYNVSKVVCLEPYNTDIFDFPIEGTSLVSSSRPVSTIQERTFAGKFADIVDMEAYALAKSATIFNKNLQIIKMVTDFSHDCDIHKNILKFAEKLSHKKEIWTD